MVGVTTGCLPSIPCTTSAAKLHVVLLVEIATIGNIWGGVWVGEEHVRLEQDGEPIPVGVWVELAQGRSEFGRALPTA